MAGSLVNLPRGPHKHHGPGFSKHVHVKRAVADAHPRTSRALHHLLPLNTHKPNQNKKNASFSIPDY
ncbi:unnamed protein product [Periconia digitata]|uniref:Uncharacterized protein n=1 Tax=Periconia digitata TaxID=1303443 RepID=A0A9W4XJY3_9PLEO|nr:unnamed protein product [Periconia digitata]